MLVHVEHKEQNAKMVRRPAMQRGSPGRLLAWVSGLAVSALLAFWMSESACLKCPICSYALARLTRALW